MRKILLSAFAAASIMIQAQNPFFQEFNTAPHGAAPFDKITFADYEPVSETHLTLPPILRV